MRLKRYLFIALILFLIIFSVSFVNASDNLTSDEDTNNNAILSTVSDENVLDVNFNDIVNQSNEELSSSKLGLTDDVEKREIENESKKAQILRASNDEQSNESVEKLTINNAQVLGVSNDVDVLGAYDRDLYTGSVNDIINAMKDISNHGGGTLYLHGGTYGGSYSNNAFTTIQGVTVCGGDRLHDGRFATLTGGIYGADGGPAMLLANWQLKDVTFDSIRSRYGFLQFQGAYGSLTNVVVNNCNSSTQFITISGNRGANRAYPVINCNFTNCHQVFEGSLYDVLRDGHGQLFAVFGTDFENCNFINTSSNQHGGAMCIADESKWGESYTVPTTIKNSNFINITSKWFAVYIHGHFKDSEDWMIIDSPEIIENCNFINCTGTEEYGAVLGISHDDLIVRNCNFTNNTGGQGTAIMVGGLTNQDDTIDDHAFNGQNTKGNNITIIGSRFINNQANHHITATMEVIDQLSNSTGWSSGNAGAIYVFGNDTKIIDSYFENNTATNGSAIYIVGQRTLVSNSEFYKNDGDNGTIFIQGNYAKIIDSKFHENHAEIGSAIYILGSRTEINNSTFENNNGTNGTVYIKGDNTKIISGSNFTDNNASYGGGVYIAGTNTLISGSNFDRNNATHDGGGMYIKGDNTHITSHSNFTENHAVNGGGIYLGGTNTEISASNFVRNNATYDGAGMYVKGNNTRAIDGSNFTENNAAHDGAGMYIEGMNTLISNTYFEKNNATNGAGIYIKGNNTNITAGSDFMENTAAYGAGAYLEGSYTLIKGSKFERNNATEGAGMFISGNNTKITSGSNFTENNATNGAGIYIEGSNTLISGSNFEKNNATNGAGMFISGNRTNITAGSDFIENTAVNGGGMYVEGSYTLVSGSKFEKNNVTNNGAGMFISGNDTKITSGSYFTENNATNGAGIYIDGSGTLISGSNFEKNNATNGAGMFISGNRTNITAGSDFIENTAVNGGGMYVEGSYTLVSGSKFEKNNATNNGAGMFISGNRTNITAGSDFIENTAVNGAGIYVDGSKTNIEGSIFKNNNATNGAGGYIDGSQTVISDSTFEVNNATDGAGIYVIGVGTEITESTFNNNSAVNGAGGYIDGKDTKILDSTFEINNATNGAGFYITGNNTQINGSTFNNNSAVNGAGGFVDGKDTKIFNSTFEINNATDGAGIYITGNNTQINGSTFNNNSAVRGAGGFVDGKDTKIFNSTFEINNATNGAGIYVKGLGTQIDNSTFVNNQATDGAGGYVDGSGTTILDSTFKINNATDGAGIYVKGTQTKILNTTFYNNTATNGAGGYVVGSNTNISSDSLFKYNNAVNGAGIYVDGASTEILNTTFDNNTAVNGGGAYLKGKDTKILNSTFIKNNVTYHGGAVYIDGSQSNIKNNNFTYNEAVPDNSVSELSGLGGAIFVKGNDTYTFANDFEHNKARNGSAIYSTGNNFRLENDLFRENQAWSYLLITIAEPEVSYVNTHDVKIEVVHRGGDNMINAIHSNASFEQIGLKNVTYVHSSGENYSTNPNEFQKPVDGVENSNNGALLYQDDREYLQKVTISVVYESESIADSPRLRSAVVGEEIYYSENLTHLYGDLYVTLPKEILQVGKYKVTATHPEDWNYKEIYNTTKFWILPYVDLSVNKTSDKYEYFDDDIAVWTITVSNANNASKATNVVVDDILPSDFKFINATATLGSYNNHTGLWTIPSLANGTNATLTIYSRAEANIERLNHFVYIDSDEDKVKLVVTRVSDKDSYKEDDDAIWTLTVTNEGEFTAHNVNITHLIPFEFEYNSTIGKDGGDFDIEVHTGHAIEETGQWYFDLIRPGEIFTLEIKTKATYDDPEITDYINVDYKEKHLNLTVNKSSDKEEYIAGQIAYITIKVKNNPGSPATNVVLNNVLQPEFEFNRILEISTGSYDETANVWTIGDMAEDTEATLVLETHTIVVYGVVTNYAIASSDEADWNESNNIANASVEVVPLPQPSKSVSNLTPDYHDLIEYNLTIYNTGNTTYRNNLTVSDILPVTLDFVEFINVTGADIVYQTNSSGDRVKYIVEGQKITWIITNISNKSSAIITVKLHVNGLGNLITNTSVINSIYNLANNPSLFKKLVELTNDAAFMRQLLDATGNSPFIRSLVNLSNYGNTFNKLIELVNNEAYVEAIGDLTNETFKQELIGLTKNSVGINSTGNLTNYLTVTGPNGTNVTDSCSIYPRPIVDVSVNITSDKDEYFVDDIAVWTITVFNAGNGTNATNVTLKDLFPYDRFEFINCTLNNGTRFDNSTGVWYIGFMGNGTNVTFTVYSRAIANGTAIHNVTVSCNETDWNKTNNKNNKTVVVVPLPHPVKTVNNITPYYHDVIEYNLTIVNTGTTKYAGVLNVTDSLPDGLIFNGTYKVSGANETASFVNINNQKLTWFITNITGKKNATITVFVKVIALGVEINDSDVIEGIVGQDSRVINRLGNLTNNVTVTGPNGTVQSDNCTVYPVPIVDVSVEITSDKDEYFVDDIAVWTITVFNAGNGTNATNVTLKDLFPYDRFEFINCTLNNGSRFDNSTGVWYIGFMGNGTNVTFTVYSRAIANGTAIHNVTVSCNETDWNKTNNKNNKTVVVVPLPHPVKSVNNITPYYHDVIEYNLTIVNTGTTKYTGVLNVTDSLPDGLIFNGTYKVNGANETASFVNINNQKLTWFITNITGKKNATITLYVKVNALGNLITDSTFIEKIISDSDVKYIGNLTNNVTVTGPNGTVQSDNCTVYPVPIVDVSVNITSDKDEYFVDDIAVWTITVSNAGNGTNATNVTLKDVFPYDRFEFINCTLNNGSRFDNSTGVWYIGFMGNGTNVTFTVYSRAIANGTAIHNVTVSCNETDWNKTNNKNNKTVVVVPLPHPVKSVNNITPNYHDVIEYNLTIVNTGTNDYNSTLVVVDRLPEGLLFNGTFKYDNCVVLFNEHDGRTFTWNITNIPRGKNATITVFVKVVGLGDLIYNDTFVASIIDNPFVKYVGNLTNNVTVTGPNGTVQSDNCTVYPVPVVDLSVTITSDKDEYFVDDIAKWTITVSNAANGTNATNISLRDLFPDSFFDYWQCKDDKGNEWDLRNVIPFIGNGTNITFTVTSKALTPGENINHTVKVQSEEKEWNYTNNNATKLVKIVPLPQPVKTVSNDTPYYHDEIEYNLTVENVGTNIYNSTLTVLDSLPAGLEFVEVVKVIGADVAIQSGDGVVHKIIDGKDVYYLLEGQKITWRITNISAKSNATIIIKVKVNDIGNLTNNLTVTGPRYHSTTVNETVYPVPIVDVSVNITSDKDEYFVDDIAVWTITVSNAGNGTNATNVTLKDVFPYDRFEFINCTLNNGTRFDNSTGVWYIGFMGNGTNVTFTVYSRAIANGTAIHNVTVSCNETDWNKTNNKNNKTVVVVPLPHPVKSVNNITPYYHDVIEYNLTIVNTGSTNYTGVLNVTDSLPDGLIFNGTYKVNGANETASFVNINNQKLTWFITNITGKKNATITVFVKVVGLGDLIYDGTFVADITNNNPSVKYVGNLTNNVTVTGPNGTVQSDNCTVYPVPIVDVSVNITSDKDEYFIDDIAVWTITVSNAGNGTNATNVTLKDLFPSEYFEFINCTDSEGNEYNLDDDWVIPFMGNGTNVTFVIYSQAVNPGVDVNNTAEVNCTENEWDYDNNNATKLVDVVVLPQPVKEVSNSTPYYHDIIEYNLTVVNSAKGLYRDNLTVVDSLPVGLEFNGTVGIDGAAFVGDVVVDGQVITWKITNITARATITVKVKVNDLGNLTNNLTIIGPRGTNATVNCTVYPVPLVDVSVNITSDKDEYFIDDIAVWTITVSNAGNGTNATNINLKDLFPSEYFEFINCTDSEGNVYNLTDDWVIPFMGNGTNVTFVIYSQAVNPGVDVNNTAKVNCTEDDWDYDNNNATKLVDVVVLPQPVKEVSNSTPYYHDIIEYNLTVVNSAKNVYRDNLTVVDSLPVGLEFNGTVGIDGAVFVGDVAVDGQVITWKITNITTGRATITVKVKVNDLGNLTNNLTIIGPRGTNATVNCTVDPMPLVDVSINITSDKDEYFVDDVAVWTITVSNADNGTNATNVSLKDLFPSDYFVFVNCTDENGTLYELGDDWVIPFIGNGTNVTLVIHSIAKVPSDNITNSINATCSEDEWNYNNNNASKSVEIVAFHQPEKVVSNSTPYYHDIVEYTLTVMNLGNYTYTTEFDVIDSLPEGLKYLGTVGISNATLIRETENGQVVTWALTNIPAKSSATIVIRVQVNAIGNLTNNLTVIGPHGATDMVDCTIDPIPLVEVSVNITSDKDEYFVDDVAVWTITVSNADNASNATNVSLKDLFPSDNFVFVNCTDENGTLYELGDDWVIPFIGNGTNVTLVIHSIAKVPSDNITNSVNVTCSEEEWNYNNNNASKTVEIVAFHQPEKVVSNSTPYYHDIVEYTLSVMNLGNNTYTGEFDVIDSLPEGLKYLGTVGISNATLIRETENGQVVTWALTNIPAKSSATIVIRVQVNAIGNLTNNLTVIGPHGATDMVDCTIDPIPLVEVSVNITSDKDEYFVDDVAVWTITVSNADNASNATNVSLKDLFPSDNFVFVNCTDENGTLYELGDDWVIPFIGNGTNVTLVIHSIAKVPAENITNSANVTCNEEEWNYNNNNASKTVEIVPFHQPEKVVSNSTPYYHDIVEYTLSVMNLGSNMYVSEFDVIDSLPVGLKYLGTVKIYNATLIRETVDGQVVTWALTNIPANSSATIVIRVQVNDLGSLTNNLTVIGPHNATDMVDCTINPVPIVDVSVNITSDKDEYFVDDIAVWTITVSNAGNGTNATNVTLKDLFPPEFEFIDCILPNGTTYNETTGVWDIGFMGNGTEVTLVIISHAITPADNITNSVNATCSEDEWNYNNNAANKTVSIGQFPEIEKSVNNATPYNHDIVEYTLTIKNIADIKYTNDLVVIDSLPDGLIFIGTVSIDGADIVENESVDGQTISWVITNISAKSNAVITVYVFVNGTDEFTNNLTIISPNGYNETVNCTINPVPVADLEVTITNDVCENCTVKNGDTVVWTITVHNNGPDTAVNTTLWDILPEGLIYDSDDSNGTYDPETGVWTIGDVPVGGTVTLTITTIVNASNVTITNPVKVTSDTYDPDESNNYDNSSVTVVPEADLEVIKSVSVIVPHKGDVVTWTIIVKNNGADTAVNAVVTDKLPAGLIYVSDSSKGAYDPETGVWNVGDLVSGQSVRLTIKTIVDKTYVTIVNSASVTSDTYDPNEKNNYCNASIAVPPEADLEITVEPDVTEVNVGDKVIYTVTVVNHGPDSAINARAKIAIPDALKLLGYKPSKGTYDPETGIWTIGDLAPGEKVTLILETEALVSGKIIINATVSSDTYDPSMDNNNAAAEISVNETGSNGFDEVPAGVSVPKLPATGNPIAMILLALLAIVAVTVRRKG